MKVFVTGATGFIGSSIIKELINNGHQVSALARNEEAVNKIIAAGAEAHRGDLEDLESLRSGAAASDGVIHAGFIHDFSRFAEVCEADKKAIEALGSALVGTERPLIVTSGTLLVTPGRLAVETDMPNPAGHNPRIASENAADAVRSLGVRVGVLRLPPSVHGEGDHGFVPMLINIAREKGVSAYIGEGLNRWPAVHRHDAATLYRLALEKNFDAGTRFHGVAEEGIAFRKIAEVIGKRLNIPVVGKSVEEAASHFTWFTHFAAIDGPASGKHTQEQLQWKLSQPGLIEDIDADSYFAI